MSLAKNDLAALQSQTIDWIRFPLIILVVFIHNPGVGIRIPDIQLPTGEWNVTDYYNQLRYIIRLLTSFAVPTFFLISGYLFFYQIKSFNKETFFHKLRSRIKTLLIPYLLWNLLTLLYNFAFDPIYTFVSHLVMGNPFIMPTPKYNIADCFRAFWDINRQDYSSSNLSGFEVYSTFPIDGPLWYVRDLILLVLLSPIIYYLLKKFNWGVLLLFFLPLIISFMPHTYPGSMPMFFYTLGAYFSIQKKYLITEFNRIKYISGLGTLLLFLLIFSRNVPHCSFFSIKPFFILFATITIFNLSASAIKRGITKVNISLTKMVFFIFALHNVMFVELYDIFIRHRILSLGMEWISLIEFLMVPFLKILICIITYNLMSIYLPKTLNVLTGNRIKISHKGSC